MKKALTLLAASLLLSACTLDVRHGQAAGLLHHVVILWLKEPGNPAHRAAVIEASEGLRTIPGVIDLRAGSVVPGERDIVDGTFDVALVVTFADRAAMQAYLEHPVHTGAVRNVLQPLVGRIVVYDFVE